jgi:hypothetical protein
MPEVELILKADNAQYISKVREAQQANQELHTSVEKSRKREKGLIEDIEEEITKLEAARKKAGTTEDIEKYNKKLAEAKKDLQEYNKVGLETVKTQGNISKSTNELTNAFNGYLKKLGPVAIALAAVVKVGKEVVKAFKDTVLGLNAATYAAQFWETIGYNIATGNLNMARSFNVAAAAAKQMNQMRKEERDDIVEVAKLRGVYNKLYFESADRTEDESEQLDALNKAMIVHNKLIDIELKMAAQRLQVVMTELVARPKSNKLLDEEAKLRAELINIEGRRYSETKRVEQRRTSLEKSVRDERMRAYMNEIDETLRKQDEFQKLSLKLLDDYLQAQIEKLEGPEKLRAQRDFMLKALREQINTMREAGTLTAEQEAMFDEIASDIFKSFEKSIRDMTIPGRVDTEGLTESAEKWIDLFARNLGIESLNAKIGELKPFKGALPGTKKTIWDIFGLTPEQGKESLQGLSEVADNLVAVYSNITDRMVEEAQRRRELYDTQIAEAQRALELETELFKEGYANNVEAKRREVESLKKLRDEALKDEEKARKAQATLDTILQLMNMTTASTEIFKSFSKIPIVGIPLAIAMIGTMFAAFATAKARAASITKLAEGGAGDETGIVKGRSHAAGGERFLDHIEVERGERWGVLNRRASDKYGRVFNEIVSSFNKNEMPSFLASENVNNITVNNDGSNSRLDRVIAEQRSLNEKLGKNEQVLISGHRKVIKKGNKIRIIG